MKKIIRISGIIIVTVVLLVLIVFMICTTAKNTKTTVEFVSIDTLCEEEKNTSPDQEIFFDDKNVIEEIPFVFDIKDVPSFRGNPYIEINDNKPLFSKDEINTNVFEKYSELDDLGRCGVAYANLCMELMPLEERGVIGDVRPSGWQTVKYNEIIDDNYLYNRCHLIGYQLAGENANVNNLITGTRYLNIDGMLPFENEIALYIQETNNHVLYRVTPIFEDDNLVASGVTMEAYSVEDNGKGICFYVFVYNVQPGIIIDYASGDNELDPAYIIPEIIKAEADTFQEDVSEEISGEILIPEGAYVVNTSSGKFHIPSCDSVMEMKEKNKMISTESREELINQGYSPCKACNP